MQQWYNFALLQVNFYFLNNHPTITLKTNIFFLKKDYLYWKNQKNERIVVLTGVEKKCGTKNVIYLRRITEVHFSVVVVLLHKVLVAES